MFRLSTSFGTLGRLSFSAATFLLMAVGSLSPATAAILTGSLGISAAPNNQATVTASTITFGAGLFSVTGGTGSFNTQPTTNFDSPTFTGVIKNLDSSPLNQPTGVLFSLPNFLTFASNPTTFELTYIFPGTNGGAQCSAPAAGGQVCTPPGPGLGSPFNLQNNSATQSTASFTVAGNVRNGSDVMLFTGVFSTPFNNQSFQDILSDLARNGSVTAPYSATFTVTAIPEPATFGMVGLALLGAARMLSRRRA